MVSIMQVTRHQRTLWQEESQGGQEESHCGWQEDQRKSIRRPTTRLFIMTINKIVVMGASFTRPGQSGITKCWSQWLEEQTNIPVINLTWDSGGSNSEIARMVCEYVWSNDVSNTAFIIQWTVLERSEFCYDDAQWIQVNQATNTKNGKTLTEQQLAISKRLLEANTLSYSTSTYFWDWLQKIITVSHVLKKHDCPYFQWHMTGTEIKEILTGVKPIAKDFNLESIVKTVSKTPWLFGNVLKAQPQNFHTVSDNDPHPNDKGSLELATMFYAEVKRRGWI